MKFMKSKKKKGGKNYKVVKFHDFNFKSILKLQDAIFNMLLILKKYLFFIFPSLTSRGRWVTKPFYFFPAIYENGTLKRFYHHCGTS